MADPRFFHRTGPYTLGHIASITGATIERGSADLMVNDIAPLDLAGAGQLSFLDNARYRDAYRASKAAACFVSPEMVADAPQGMALLVTKTPYKANALAAQAFYPDVWPKARIAASATIDPSAIIGDGCVIEENVVIGADVQLGRGSWVEPNAVIGVGCALGERCRVGSNVTLSHCQIGQATRIYPGARIGQDGFGFAIDPAGFVKVPQLGRVIIGVHAEIGANTCIDRGASGDTVIGDGCWIDNLVQIAHNVKLGRGCVIVAQVGIAGSTTFDDYVVIGGQAGVAGHLKVGKGVRIAAQSGVMRDVPAGAEVMGFPAISIKQFMRQAAILNKMTKSKDKK